ncbi:MAG: S-layer homology domain-containing protein, partial [Clostridiales bacterium]|nr:S-layer homology domain-containing protein [Clostridiales bacterium]
DSYKAVDEDSALAHNYDGEVTLAATCEDEGEMTYTCSLCGDVYTEVIPANGHSYGEGVYTAPECGADGYTTFTCDCGDSYKAVDEDSALAHNYDGEVTLAATCEDEGEMTYTCSLCGGSYTEVIPANGHSYGEGVYTAPACEVDGYTTFTCDCGDSYKAVDEGTALNHVWGEGAVTTAPTYTAPGVMTFTCTVCGETKTEAIPMLTFIYGDVNGDGTVDAADATKLAKYLVGHNDQIVLEAADLDGDGEITMKDLAILQRHLAGWVGYENLPYMPGSRARVAVASFAQPMYTYASYEAVDGEPTINVGDASAKVGEIVKLPISIENNPGIVTMRLFVEYDDAVLKLVEVNDAGALGTQIHSNNIKSPYILFWENGLGGKDIQTSGEIATLSFEVLAKGTSDVTVSYNGEGMDIFNIGFERVRFGVNNGEVTVEGKITDGEDIDNTDGDGNNTTTDGDGNNNNTTDGNNNNTTDDNDKVTAGGAMGGGGGSIPAAAPETTIIDEPSTPLAKSIAKLFGDVSDSDWFYDAIQYVVGKGIMNGTSESEFSPSYVVTRAMMVTVLYRMEGEPSVSGNIPFADVNSGQWYSDAILWASQNNIVLGYGNGMFGLNDPITREQAVAILYRYSGDGGQKAGISMDMSKYVDQNTVSSWAMEAMQWAAAEEIVSGRPGDRIAPKDTSTRAELATILMRYLEDFLGDSAS